MKENEYKQLKQDIQSACDSTFNYSTFNNVYTLLLNININEIYFIHLVSLLTLLKRLYFYLDNNDDFFLYHYNNYKHLVKKLDEFIQFLSLKKNYKNIHYYNFKPVLNSIQTLDNVTHFKRFAFIPPYGIIVQRYLKEYCDEYSIEYPLHK